MFSRKRLYYIIRIGAFSGLRLGTEITNLKWSGVEWRQSAQGHDIFTLRTVGKLRRRQAERVAVIPHTHARFMREWIDYQKTHGVWSTDAFVFGGPNGEPPNMATIQNLFRRILKKYDLRHDPEGKIYTLYNVRGYAITKFLRDKDLPIPVVAKHFNTSIEMISRYYYDYVKSPDQSAMLMAEGARANFSSSKSSNTKTPLSF